MEKIVKKVVLVNGIGQTEASDTEVKDMQDNYKETRAKSKKFVRYADGAELYSMSVSKFMQMAKDAKACYKVNQLVLVNLEIIDKYLETFHIVEDMIHGVYEIDDVVLSMPVIVGADGIESDIPINLSGEEALKLKESADALKNIIDTLEL